MNGYREKKTPTKKAIAAKTASLEQGFVMLMQRTQQQLQDLHQRIITLERQQGIVDYRSLATYKELVRKNLLVESEHDEAATALRIADFDRANALDSTENNLIDAATPIDNGKIVVMTVDAVDTTTSQKVDELSILRSKVEVGTGRVLEALEQALLGLNAGDVKTFTTVLPEKFGVWSGKSIEYTVRVLQVLTTAPAPVADVTPAS